MNQTKSGFARQERKPRKPPDKFSPAILSIILTRLIIFCGRLLLVNGFHAHKLSDFTGSIRWTTSLGIFAHNSSNLGFEYNHHFARANNSSDIGFGYNHHFARTYNLSDLAGTIEWTPGSGFFAHKNSNFASSKRWTTSSGIFVHNSSDLDFRSINLSQKQTTLANSRAPKNGHQARVSSRTKIATCLQESNHETTICQSTDILLRVCEGESCYSQAPSSDKSILVTSYNDLIPARDQVSVCCK